LASSVTAIFLGLFVFIFAEQIVNIVLGNNWDEVVPIIKILAFYGVLRTMFGNFASLFLALEKQDYVAKMIFVRVSVLFITIIPLINIYGLSGAAYAAVISTVAEVPIALFFLLKIKML